MVALRSFAGREDGLQDERAVPHRPDPAEWLTLQQAACELNVSATTVRRMLRAGKLRNRIVPRRGGITYLIYLPNSRHAAYFGALARASEPIQLDEQRAARGGPRLLQDSAGDGVRRLRRESDRFAQALSRLRGQVLVPVGAGGPGGDPGDPYARYRQLARRRRWWPFS